MTTCTRDGGMTSDNIVLEMSQTACKPQYPTLQNPTLEHDGPMYPVPATLLDASYDSLIVQPRHLTD